MTCSEVLLILVLYIVKIAFPIEVLVCSNFSSTRDATHVSSLMPPRDPLQLSNARSEIECAIVCNKNRRCMSAFQNDATGTCFLFDKVNYSTLVDLSKQEGHWNGQRGIILSKPTWNIKPDSPCEITCSQAGVCGRDCTDCNSRVGYQCSIPPDPMCWAQEDDCSEELMGNIRQFYIGKTNQAWTTDHATEYKLQTRVYPKKSSTSGLHVTLLTDFRGAKGCTSACCGTLYFKFNGAKCPASDVIDILHYESNLALNYIKVEEVDGICKGLAAGDVTIDVYVRNCDGYTGNSAYNSQTVFASNTYARLMVREVDMSTSLEKTTCSALTSFNVKQAFWRTAASVNNAGVGFAVITFPKRISSTGIRVVWRGQLREHPTSGTHRCGRYYFKFNDVECSNPGKVDAVLGQLGYSDDKGNQLRDAPIGGICYGIAAGSVKIQLWHQTCSGYSNYSPYQGWNSYSRIIVEEVRLNSKISAYVRPDGTSIRVPQFNLAHHYWYALNDDKNDGVIKEVTYNKLSSRSALKVRWMSTLRVYRRPGVTGTHCFWYFTFNNTECSTPGPIRAIIYQSHDHNLHQPAVVEGMCELPHRGSTTVAFKVEGPGDCYTGWLSSSNFEISEVHLSTD